MPLLEKASGESSKVVAANPPVEKRYRGREAILNIAGVRVGHEMIVALIDTIAAEFTHAQRVIEMLQVRDFVHLLAVGRIEANLQVGEGAFFTLFALYTPASGHALARHRAFILIH